MLTVTEHDLVLRDGRTLHVYDACAEGADSGLPVFWHHGTPNIGAPPEPLFRAAAERGVRWVSYDRPGYGGSTPRPGRDPDNGVTAIEVGDADGVKPAGLLVDAGPVNSDRLIEVGPDGASAGHAANPTSLQDVFVRIGGAGPGRATTGIVVNSNDTLRARRYSQPFSRAMRTASALLRAAIFWIAMER